MRVEGGSRKARAPGERRTIVEGDCRKGVSDLDYSIGAGRKQRDREEAHGLSC